MLRMEVPATRSEKGEVLWVWNELECIAAILVLSRNGQKVCQLELRGVVMGARPERCKCRRGQRGLSISELGETTYDAHSCL